MKLTYEQKLKLTVFLAFAAVFVVSFLFGLNKAVILGDPIPDCPVPLG